MSLAIVYSRASMGVQAPLVTIEVHLSNGKPGFTLVGLPEKTVKEAQDRVRSALMNAQFKYPANRITVNLAPADLPCVSSVYGNLRKIQNLKKSLHCPMFSMPCHHTEVASAPHQNHSA